jgi:hypothetical protein
MSDDRLKNIEEAVRRIESGMFDDEELNHIGVIGVQKQHGERITRIERAGIYLVVPLEFSGMAYKIAVDWWPHK